MASLLYQANTTGASRLSVSLEQLTYSQADSEDQRKKFDTYLSEPDLEPDPWK